MQRWEQDETVYTFARPGIGQGGSPRVFVLRPKRDPVELLPDKSQKIRNHSPDGFNWGYGGSGPAQLALALLLDYTGSETLARIFYQGFKWTVLASWQADEWQMTGAQLRQWFRDRINLERGLAPELSAEEMSALHGEGCWPPEENDGLRFFKVEPVEGGDN
jgi:hypothetical protein